MFKKLFAFLILTPLFLSADWLELNTGDVKALIPVETLRERHGIFGYGKSKVPATAWVGQDDDGLVWSITKFDKHLKAENLFSNANVISRGTAKAHIPYAGGVFTIYVTCLTVLDEETETLTQVRLIPLHTCMYAQVVTYPALSSAPPNWKAFVAGFELLRIK